VGLSGLHGTLAVHDGPVLWAMDRLGDDASVPCRDEPVRSEASSPENVNDVSARREHDGLLRAQALNEREADDAR
jgi:hypothetical protein